MRLELLQGVAAFHRGNKQASHYLSSALDKWQRLQVCDEALATLASMGFTTSQVTSALALVNNEASVQADIVAGKPKHLTVHQTCFKLCLGCEIVFGKEQSTG